MSAASASLATSALHEALPEAIDSFKASFVVEKSHIIERIHDVRHLVSTGETAAAPGAKHVDVHFNSLNDLPLDSLRIKFEGLKTTGGTNSSFPSGIFGLIESVEILVNGTSEHTWPDFGRTRLLQYALESSADGIAGEVWGSATRPRRRVLAPVAHDYEASISDLFAAHGQNILPLSTLLGKTRFTLRFGFYEANECLNATAITPTWTCDRFLCVSDGVKLTPEGKKVFDNGVVFYVNGWTHNTTAVAAAEVSKTITVRLNHGNIQSFTLTATPTADTFDVTAEDRLENYHNIFTSFGGALNGQRFPQRDVEMGTATIATAYHRLIREMHGFSSSGPNPNYVADITEKQFYGLNPDGINKCVLTQDFRAQSEVGIMSGVSMTANDVVEFTVYNTGTFGGVYTLHYCVNYIAPMRVETDHIEMLEKRV